MPGGLAPEDVSVWQRIRRYAVPRWMIEQATAHRLAGDWRAACAAAAVDPVFDLDGLAARFGEAAAAAVTEDLRHLAPDLMRWHLPRLLGGRTTLDTDCSVLLACYGPEAGSPELLGLYVTTTPMMEGPQRLRLVCAPIGTRFSGSGTDWTRARHLWDARHAAELRARFAGGADRLPFFRADGTPLTEEELPAEDPGTADPAARAEWAAVLLSRGESVEACAVAGMELDPAEAGNTPRYYRDPAGMLTTAAPDLLRIADGFRRLVAAGAGDRFRVPVHWRWHFLLMADGQDASAPVRVGFVDRDTVKDVPCLPGYAWHPDPDLHLVRAGRIAPDELHPLVAAALFPEAGPADGPPLPAAPAPVRVRCRGEWHEVRFRDGELDMPHTPQEQQREQALRAFGGAVAGCFAVRQTVATGNGRLPRALREQRRELMLRAQHGDTPGVLALLDAGFDPRMKLPNDRSLLHLLHLLDHEELLPRLLAAGLDLEAKDKTDRTPLMMAVTYGGSVSLVRALLEAGSRIDIVDNMDMSLAQIIRRYHRTDLGFLSDRVKEEFPDIGNDWWDDWMDDQSEYYDEEEEEDDE
ncbi:ankyrin repeat domain-containing protein [Streptomyces bambusae]|uniref:Ankyrin repeat domain-containing protein n=2 Tax=Streptomyces bambusae TaxID=1550616 RepID=A0ABS6ZAN5_9ACTN|nr:ankyrin repeat domain-containing protein [Streptomyces bambusae]